MHERKEPDEPRPDVTKGHETRDISTRVVVIFGVSLLVGAILIHIAVWVVYSQFARDAARAYPREYPLAHVGPAQLPPQPRLQTTPREDLQRMRTEEEQVLNSYGWVDVQRGIVRIPIERAMALTVEQGLPARTGGAPFSPADGPDKSDSGRALSPFGR
jgi:hypothetical protein